MKPILKLAMALVLVVLTTTGALATSFNSTEFAYNTETFSNLNDQEYQNFTVNSGTISFVFRFVSQYRATAAVINASSLAAFQSGASVSTYAVFNDTFGTNGLTLGPGSYAVVVRNDTQGSNTYRYELDYLESLPGGSFVDYYLENQGTVSPNGGKFWQPFTIQQGYRYWMDGANTGTQTYILDSANFALWQAGDAFSYYSDYSGDDPQEPGGYEVALPPGDYYLCFENDTSESQAVCYTCSRWTGGSGSGGSSGGGSTSGNGGGSDNGGGASGDAFGGVAAGSGLYYSSWFGYYSYIAYPFIYHDTLGYEYVFPSGSGVYLYDYRSNHFWYTQQTYYPFVYDFSLGAFLYYYTNNANGAPRYFYKFSAVNPGVISE